MKLLQISVALVALGGLACHSDRHARTPQSLTAEQVPELIIEPAPAPTPAPKPAPRPTSSEAPKKARSTPKASHRRSVAAPIEVQLGSTGLTGHGDTDVGRITGIENRPLVSPDLGK